LSNLPGKSYDDVRQHDDWYSEYLILLDKKRKAIQEWKHHKDVSSSLTMKKVTLASLNNLPISLPMRMKHIMFIQTDKMDKLLNVNDTEKTDVKEKRKAELFEKERQERLSKLGDWKVLISLLLDPALIKIHISVQFNICMFIY
jgi:hypothetical protein